MDGVCHAAAHTRHRAECICPHPEVGNGAEEFHRVVFLLKRVAVRRRFPDQCDCAALYFHRLPGRRGFRQDTLRHNGRAGGDFFQRGVSFCRKPGVFIKCYLYRRKAGAVIHLDKYQIFCLTFCADPAAHRYRLSGRLFR